MRERVLPLEILQPAKRVTFWNAYRKMTTIVLNSLQIQPGYPNLSVYKSTEVPVMDERPHPYRKRMDRCADPDQIHLVTTTTQNRIPWFRDFRKARQLVRCLMDSQHRGRSNTLAYVVMPDQLHWLLVPGENQDLSLVVGALKTASVHRIGRALWQTGFHGQVLPREEDPKAISRYVIANPVRAGLVKGLRDYPHWDAVWLQEDDRQDRLSGK